MRLFVTIFLLVLLLASAGCVEKPVSDVDKGYVAENIDIILKSDSATYGKGENITISAVLKNNGTQMVMIKDIDVDINISLPTGSPARYVNLQQIHSYDQGIYIKAGRSVIEKIRWNQMYVKNRTQYIAEPGIYILRADVRLTMDNVMTNSTFVSSFVANPLMITIEG